MIAKGGTHLAPILMTLGVERYGLRVTEMVAVLGVRYNSACLWSRCGATRRQEDRAFAETLDGVDSIIASSPQEETKRSAENILMCKPGTLPLPLPLPLAPARMVGSMAAVPLPAATREPAGPFAFDPLQDELYHSYRIEAPVITWLPGPGRVLRISAQLYNSTEQVDFLASALQKPLDTEGSR